MRKMITKPLKNNLAAMSKPGAKMPAVKPAAMKPASKHSAIHNLGKYAHAPMKRK